MESHAKVDDIALTMLPQIGPKTAAHLLSVFGTAEALFSAGPEQLTETAGLRADLARHIPKKSFHRQAEAELAYCRRHGITPIASDSSLYPALLLECNDYPHVLYYMGDPTALSSRRMISFVGTRKMTSYGQRVCDTLIAGLADMYPDLVVVSGLAYGIDAACHRAALSHGLPTIAVLANQLPDIYPSQHSMLASQMCKQGGLMTEYNSTNRNKGVNFVPRNRLIAGISAGTVVVESGARGGSLITAAMADGYHRIVMAVPGRLGDAGSEGCNQLIKAQKAAMICSAADISRELAWEKRETDSKPTYDTSLLSAEAAALLQLLPCGEQIELDLLAEKSGLPIARLAPLIFELEFEGAIRMLPGKLYERA